MSTVRDPSSHLATHAPWSHSKAELAGKCPRAFKFRYLDKVERKEGSAAKVGTVGHLVLEKALEGMPPLQALDEALEAFPGLATGEIRDVRKLLPPIIAFLNRIDGFRGKQKIAQELYEQQWAIGWDHAPCDYNNPDALFRGALDLTFVMESGAVLIVDHKSGRLRPPDYYLQQLETYAVLAQAHIPNLTSVQFALHYVAFEKVEWYKPVPAKRIKELLKPNMLRVLNNKAKNLGEYAPTPSKSNCQFCDYKHLCDVAFVPEKKERMKKVVVEGLDN